MKLKDKYLAIAKYEKLKQEDKDKEERVILSNEGFAICEFIELLISKLEQTRNSV